MRAVSLIIGWLFLIGCAQPAFAGELEDAQKAVSEIKKAISQGEFASLFDTQTSAFFKARTARDGFIASMKQGRENLGPVRSSTFVSHTYSEKDLQTGFEAKMYSFDYLSRYERGNFYERLVVCKEADGRYRLSGIWANPAPPQ